VSNSFEVLQHKSALNTDLYNWLLVSPSPDPKTPAYV